MSASIVFGGAGQDAFENRLAQTRKELQMMQETAAYEAEYVRTTTFAQAAHTHTVTHTRTHRLAFTAGAAVVARTMRANLKLFKLLLFGGCRPSLRQGCRCGCSEGCQDCTHWAGSRQRRCGA